MNLKEYKITAYADSVAALPDYPSDAGYSAAQLKAIFDGRTDNEIKQKFNALIDELVTRFGQVEVDIADEVEAHNGISDAHQGLFSTIHERIAEIIGDNISIHIALDEKAGSEAVDELSGRVSISEADIAMLFGIAENKVDKVEGKGLSTYDFNDEWKQSIQNSFNEAIYAQMDIDSHRGEKNNPHHVTAEQVGLGNVDNTPDSDKYVAYALNAEFDLMGNLIHETYATKAEIKEDLGEIEAIAKGRATGYVFNTLEDLDSWLSDTANTANLVLGDNLYIRATDVPDYWWDGAEKQQLETQKVDLAEYVKNTDYASSSQVGVVKVVDWAGTAVNGSGQIYLVKATNSEIDTRVGDYKPIVPTNLEYAVKSVGDGYYATVEQIGDIEAALDALHAYAVALIGGEAE